MKDKWNRYSFIYLKQLWYIGTELTFFLADLSNFCMEYINADDVMTPSIEK